MRLGVSVLETWWFVVVALHKKGGSGADGHTLGIRFIRHIKDECAIAAAAAAAAAAGGNAATANAAAKRSRASSSWAWRKRRGPHVGPL